MHSVNTLALHKSIGLNWSKLVWPEYVGVVSFPLADYLNIIVLIRYLMLIVGLSSKFSVFKFLLDLLRNNVHHRHFSWITAGGISVMKLSWKMHQLICEARKNLQMIPCSYKNAEAP